MSKLIGFTGKARSGKDTAALYLAKSLKGHKFAFADPIRDMLECIGVDAYTVADKEAPLPYIGKSLRECMQTLGTEWGRNMIHPDLWIIVAQRNIELLRNAGLMVAISDVRFDNEASMIRRLGGKIVEVIRPAVEEAVRPHVSEAGLNPMWIDHTIFNDSSIEAFHERVYGVV